MPNLPDHQTKLESLAWRMWSYTVYSHTAKHLLSRQDVQENLITTVRPFDCGNFLTVLATEQ